jgi:chemotaxis protein MotB
MARIAKEIDQALHRLIELDLIKVRRSTLWVEVEINNSVLFATGSADLEPQARPVLEQLAQILAPFPNPIRVEGFTDDRPISTAVFPSNWELSAARAAGVVRMLASLGIVPQRMAVAGYGEHRPVADNDTPEGRHKNRRVVLIILASPEAEKGVTLRRLAGMDEPAKGLTTGDARPPARSLEGT